MSNFTDFIGGGGGGGSPFPTMVFQESTTWACPVAMEALVFVIGGGGSGAARGSSSQAGQAAGGGAGGCAVSKLTLAAQNYTLTIGSGGAAATGYYSSAGNAGGASSMSGSGITTMTANGGAGGAQGSVTGVIAGGTATGGTLYNNTGGGVPTYSGTAGFFTKSGGGAVGLYADGQDGTWNAVNQQMAKGGNVMGLTIPQPVASNSVSDVSLELIHKSNMPLSSEPFPGLKFQYGYSTTFTGSPEVFSVSSGAYPRKVVRSSIPYIMPSGPFCGGAGYGGSEAFAQYAAAGIAGGGGGAVEKYANAGFPTSGGGGGGIIIICPISMGA